MARYTLDIKTLRRDAFRERMLAVAEWGYRRRRMVIGVAVGVVAAVGLGFAVWGYVRYEAGQQAALFYQAEKLLSDSTLSQDARDAAFKAALKSYLGTYPDTRLSPVAWMYLAEVAWAAKAYDEARDAYAQVREHDKSSDVARHLATLGAARVAEAQGKLEEAEELVRSLPDEGYDDLKAYHLGRMALAANKPEMAKQEFDKVISRFPPSTLAGWANDARAYLP